MGLMIIKLTLEEQGVFDRKDATDAVNGIIGPFLVPWGSIFGVISLACAAVPG
jgi:hypothetical protein